MVNDPVGDFLTRIRNAQLRKREVVSLPTSRMLESIADILNKEGFIDGFEINKKEPQSEIEVKLKYVNGVPAIRTLNRRSKPGIRKYRGYREIVKIKSGLGISIYSTPKGVMTGSSAVKERVGGEYICDIY